MMITVTPLRMCSLPHSSLCCPAAQPYYLGLLLNQYVEMAVSKQRREARKFTIFHFDYLRAAEANILCVLGVVSQPDDGEDAEEFGRSLEDGRPTRKVDQPGFVLAANRCGRNRTVSERVEDDDDDDDDTRVSSDLEQQQRHLRRHGRRLLQEGRLRPRGETAVRVHQEPPLVSE